MTLTRRARDSDSTKMTREHHCQSLLGTLAIDINAAARTYKNVTFGALLSFCSDVILRQESMNSILK